MPGTPGWPTRAREPGSSGAAVVTAAFPRVAALVRAEGADPEDDAENDESHQQTHQHLWKTQF